MVLKKKTREAASSQMLLSENSPFLMKEDYKTLRTNVSFSFPDADPKVIAITSSGQGEGKSTNAINLAISYAEIDKKVLLIDCDLRLPTIAAKMKLNQKTESAGLSNILAEGKSVGDVIQKHASGISVICAGTLPPDPTKLLQSEKMEALLGELRESFDYIILDCPPVNIVVDAVLLSSYVDGYLLVVKHVETDHREISEMLMQLKRASAKIIGFLYVNAPAEEHKYYKKYRKNYYRYE